MGDSEYLSWLVAAHNLLAFGEIPHYIPKVKVRLQIPRILCNWNSGLVSWLCHSDAPEWDLPSRMNDLREGDLILLDRVQQSRLDFRRRDGCKTEFLMQKWHWWRWQKQWQRSHMWDFLHQGWLWKLSLEAGCPVLPTIMWASRHSFLLTPARVGSSVCKEELRHKVYQWQCYLQPRVLDKDSFLSVMLWVFSLKQKAEASPDLIASRCGALELR